MASYWGWTWWNKTATMKEEGQTLPFNCYHCWILQQILIKDIITYEACGVTRFKHAMITCSHDRMVCMYTINLRDMYVEDLHNEASLSNSPSASIIVCTMKRVGYGAWQKTHEGLFIRLRKILSYAVAFRWTFAHEKSQHYQMVFPPLYSVERLLFERPSAYSGKLSVILWIIPELAITDSSTIAALGGYARLHHGSTLSSQI